MEAENTGTLDAHCLCCPIFLGRPFPIFCLCFPISGRRPETYSVAGQQVLHCRMSRAPLLSWKEATTQHVFNAHHSRNSHPPSFRIWSIKERFKRRSQSQRSPDVHKLLVCVRKLDGSGKVSVASVRIAPPIPKTTPPNKKKAACNNFVPNPASKKRHLDNRERKNAARQFLSRNYRSPRG